MKAIVKVKLEAKTTIDVQNESNSESQVGSKDDN